MRISMIAGVCSTALFALASPADAGTMTFQIDVTSATGVSGFVPFSFQQTVTLTNGTYSVHDSSFSPFVSKTYSYSGTAAATDTPNADPLKAAVGLAGAGYTQSSFGFSNHIGGMESAPSSSGSGNIYLSILWLDQISPGIYDSHSYGVSFMGNSPTSSFVPASMDEAGLAQFFRDVGPLDWSETASETIGGIFDGEESRTLTDIRYAGTATLLRNSLLPAAPEPASWAMMLIGFGLIGAALRGGRTRRSIRFA